MTTTERKAMFERLRAQHATPVSDRPTPVAVQTETPETRKTETETHEQENGFAKLLREWETICGTTDPRKGEVLETLATAVAQSVLKKLLKTGGNYQTINGLKTDIVRDRKLRTATAYATDHATRTAFNADGDATTETDDPEMLAAVGKIIKETENDGTDLVSVAVCKILMETEKATADGNAEIGWMERPYTYRRLKKRVRIKETDSVDGWEDKETTPIQETFAAVRRSVEKSRSVQVANFKYTYIETLVTDPDSGNKTVAYDRLPLYCNLVGEETDSNGRPTAVTAEKSAWNKCRYLMQAMQLTDREKQILMYRLRGYGNKAIATRLGITENACKGATNRLREKARKVGFVPNEK